jgi:hypothetical protein
VLKWRGSREPSRGVGCLRISLGRLSELVAHAMSQDRCVEEERSDLCGAFFAIREDRHASAAFRKLDGRAGPGGETLHVGLSRLPPVHTNRLWWAYEVQEDKGSGEKEGEKETYFEDEWAGLGFRRGGEEGAQGVGH